MLGDERKLPILIVVGLALVASGAGAWALGTPGLFTTVDEPISISDEDNFGEGYSTAPGETIQSSFLLQSENDSQTVVMRLQDWNGTMNESGVEAARNESGGYISGMELGDARLTFDLLNDGKADYHYMDSSDELENTYNMTVPGDSKSGDINYTVAIQRGSIEAGSDTVEMHLSQDATDNCGNCHSDEGVSSTASISQAHQTMGIANESCTNCHSASMKDMHMDCTAGCHGPKSDVQIHPNESNPTDNDYTCSSGGMDCHTDNNAYDQLAHVHRNGTVTDDYGNIYFEKGYFCPSCHGDDASPEQSDDIMGLHDGFEKDCVVCHGISSDKIHEPYNNDGDCGDCHSGMNQ